MSVSKSDLVRQLVREKPTWSVTQLKATLANRNRGLSFSDTVVYTIRKETLSKMAKEMATASLPTHGIMSHHTGTQSFQSGEQQTQTPSSQITTDSVLITDLETLKGLMKKLGGPTQTIKLINSVLS